jgi:hypothetical protein
VDLEILASAGLAVTWRLMAVTCSPIFATARRLARLIYRMLRYGQDYVDIGEKAYDLQFRIRRLAGLKEAAKAIAYASPRSRSGRPSHPEFQVNAGDGAPPSTVNGDPEVLRPSSHRLAQGAGRQGS